MKKIIIDVFGCDKPAEVVKGGILSLSKGSDFNIVFTGQKEFIENELKNLKYETNRVEIIDCKEVITNEDSPTLSIRQKKDSSLVVALEKLKEDKETVAMVSCGNTGAVLTGALFKIGRIEGIERPALAPMLPTGNADRDVLLIDCGANTDSKPEFLVQFALMGYNYMKYVFNIENPRVALLSNGTEDKKGNELTKEAFLLLKDRKDINFVGNMEARDMLTGEYDVIVADGFAGNIALKTVEGTASMIVGVLKQEICRKFRYKIAAFLMKGALKSLKQRMDYHAKGGAPLLGIEKILVKGHGSANAKAVCVAIMQAKKMSDSNLVERIKEGIKK